MSKLLIILTVCLMGVLIAGCFFEQAMPCKRNLGALKWIDPCDQTKGSIAFLGTVEDERQKLDTWYIKRQKELQAQLDINEKVYGVFAKAMDASIQDSKDLFNYIIGSPSSPGYGFALLSSVLGGLGVNKYKNSTMYSEAEVKEIRDDKGQTNT